MNKDTEYFGIDISKDVFDVYDFSGTHHQFKNSLSGFKKLMNLTYSIPLRNGSHGLLPS